ncbi:MAG: hypothetical protein B7X93_05375, partial [Hydrogenophilales bacterium 17-61-9]
MRMGSGWWRVMRQRPPVRFIFDLIKFLGEALPGWLPADVVSADWEAVSSNKQAKSEYMEAV